MAKHLTDAEFLTSKELDIIKNIINSDDVPSDARCIAISALTISVLRFFDAKKVNIILFFAEHDNNMLRQRALVGIVLIIAKYGYMIEYDESLVNRTPTSAAINRRATSDTGYAQKAKIGRAHV